MKFRRARAASKRLQAMATLWTFRRERSIKNREDGNLPPVPHLTGQIEIILRSAQKWARESWMTDAFTGLDAPRMSSI